MSTKSITTQDIKFTYAKPTKDDYIKMMGGSAHTYCTIMTPLQCKGDTKDAALLKKCQEEFLRCLQDAKRFEVWSRMN